VYMYIHDGSSWLIQAVTPFIFNDTNKHTLEAKRASGVAYIIVDGVVQASGVSTLTVSTAGTLRIGSDVNGVNPWVGGSFEGYVRISATATSAEQSKFIAARENELNGGKPCLLSSSANVTDAEYNAEHDVYYFPNGSNVDEFKGLQRNDYMVLATGVTASGNPLSAPYLSRSGTVNYYKAPAVDMNSQLKAVMLDNAQLRQGTVTKAITSEAAGTVLKFPQGFKPIRVMSAAGTYVSLSTNVPVFDGFIWSLTSGVTSATVYDCELVRTK